MLFSADDREQKFQIQLCLEIPDSCSQDTLHKTSKKLVLTFSNVPLFQVNIQGIGTLQTQIRILEVKLDNGALSTTIALRKNKAITTKIFQKSWLIAMVHFLDHCISGTQLRMAQYYLTSRQQIRMSCSQITVLLLVAHVGERRTSTCPELGRRSSS